MEGEAGRPALSRPRLNQEICILMGQSYIVLFTLPFSQYVYNYYPLRSLRCAGTRAALFPSPRRNHLGLQRGCDLTSFGRSRAIVVLPRNDGRRARACVYAGNIPTLIPSRLALPRPVSPRFSIVRTPRAAGSSKRASLPTNRFHSPCPSESDGYQITEEKSLSQAAGLNNVASSHCRQSIERRRMTFVAPRRRALSLAREH